LPEVAQIVTYAPKMASVERIRHPDYRVDLKPAAKKQPDWCF
jgi:hypothetical protein